MPSGGWNRSDGGRSPESMPIERGVRSVKAECCRRSFSLAERSIGRELGEYCAADQLRAIIQARTKSCCSLATQAFTARALYNVVAMGRALA